MTTEEWKLIDEFMGHTVHTLPREAEWNDIMPVVEKIENLAYRFHIDYSNSVIMPFKFYVYIDLYEVAGPTTEILETEYYDTKIEAAWQGIIQFIKWYNQQEKK